MKTKLFDKNGKEKGMIDLPNNFESQLRPDILLKVFETQKGIYAQAFSAMKGAGAGYSASGILKHQRHDWKSTYGKGISRVPRKILSRHGASFNWVGATVSNTRGGRKPHAPKAEKNPFKKINKKELLIAFNSGFVGTVDSKLLEKKYGNKIETGFVFDSEITKAKTKDFFDMIKNILGLGYEKAIKKKQVRAGIGKMRGRKYKSNAGMLFVVGKDEEMKRKGIEVVKVNELKVSDLAPNGEPGRIAFYTEKAVKEIGEIFR